jgi:hypothetical protein
MPQYDVTFVANVTADERITATSEDEARFLAQEMINDQKVGEHKLDLDWDIEEVVLVEEKDTKAVTS